LTQSVREVKDKKERGIRATAFEGSYPPLHEKLSSYALAITLTQMEKKEKS